MSKVGGLNIQMAWLYLRRVFMNNTAWRIQYICSQYPDYGTSIPLFLICSKVSITEIATPGYYESIVNLVSCERTFLCQVLHQQRPSQFLAQGIHPWMPQSLPVHKSNLGTKFWTPECLLLMKSFAELPFDSSTFTAVMALPPVASMGSSSKTYRCLMSWGSFS